MRRWLAVALPLAGCTPVVELPTVVVSPAQPTTADDLVAEVVFVPGTEGEGWTLRWLGDGVEFADRQNFLTLPAGLTSRGQTWRALVDGPPGAVESEPVTIGNSPPAATSAVIGPVAPTASDTLVISVDGWTDADGDDPAFEVAWFVDEQPVAGEGLQLSPGQHRRGQQVRAEVTPWDGVDAGPPLPAAAVEVVNSAPPTPEVSIAPGGPMAGEDDLVCVADVAAFDADGDPVSVTLQWSREGRLYPSEVPAATGPLSTTLEGDTVPAEDTAAGEDWTCAAVASDGDLSSEAAEATARVVAGPAPDFSLVDVNPTSLRFEDPVSPREYLQKVSGWYFGHAT